MYLDMMMYNFYVISVDFFSGIRCWQIEHIFIR